MEKDGLAAVEDSPVPRLRLSGEVDSTSASSPWKPQTASNGEADERSTPCSRGPMVDAGWRVKIEFPGERRLLRAARAQGSCPAWRC